MSASLSDVTEYLELLPGKDPAWKTQAEIEAGVGDDVKSALAEGLDASNGRPMLKQRGEGDSAKYALNVGDEVYAAQ